MADPSFCRTTGTSSQGCSEGDHHDHSYRPSRTLVLCFDGTNDVFDDTSTNVIRLFSELEKGIPSRQVVYYQPGIGIKEGAATQRNEGRILGTYARPEAPWSLALRSVGKTVDKALAWYIGTHIIGGYKFLMQHYSEGDRICLFGFSRGAFTARCLAGMLHKVGLLPKSNMEQVEFAYTLYESGKYEDLLRAEKFKLAFSMHVEVEFIGVWDTVSSVGFGAPLLNFNKSETFVRTFRHALALDERRAKFQPNPWQHTKECECRSPSLDPKSDSKTQPGSTNPNDHAICKSKEKSFCWCKYEKDYHNGEKTDVLEVWFRGFHADVGGGNEENTVRHTLANPSLRWMVTEILKSKCGVIFKKDAFEDWLPSLAAKVKAFQALSSSAAQTKDKPHHDTSEHQPTPDLGISSTTLTTPATGSSGMRNRHGDTIGPAANAPCHEDELGREQDANGKAHSVLRKRSYWGQLYDYWLDRLPPTPCGHHEEPTPEQEANARMHNMLVEKPLWWLLEVVPLLQFWSEGGGEGKDPITKKEYRRNWARARSVDQDEPRFHKSVLLRDDDGFDAKAVCRKYTALKFVHEDDEIPDEVRKQLNL
ncbi:hypothetical protein FRC04_002108 [Tulasnella sp. 424]|nr:hypothetical protein FRC04_002108 [Tulasnella sp. 424]